MEIKGRLAVELPRDPKEPSYHHRGSFMMVNDRLHEWLKDVIIQLVVRDGRFDCSEWLLIDRGTSCYVCDASCVYVGNLFLRHAKTNEVIHPDDEVRNGS